MFQHRFSSKLKNKVGVSALYMCAYIMHVYTSVSRRGREKGRRQMCLNTSSLLTETINKTTLYVSWWPGGSQDAQRVLRDWGQGRVILWAPLCVHTIQGLLSFTTQVHGGHLTKENGFAQWVRNHLNYVFFQFSPEIINMSLFSVKNRYLHCCCF